MKVYLKTCAIYIGIICLLVYIINTAYLSMLEKNVTELTTAFRKMPEQIQICNLGSSHGYYGFDYQAYPDYTCFNFAMTSQYPSYDYRLLKQYQSHLSEKAIVFIPVSYFALYGIPEEDTPDFESKNKRYYKILPPWMIKEYELRTDLYAGRFSSLSAGKDLFQVFMRQETTESYEYQELKRLKKTNANQIDVEADAQNAYLRHIVTDKITPDGKLIRNNEEIQALYDIIALCKRINATPILITLPLLQEYSRVIDEKSPEFLSDFYSIIDEITQKTGVAYYNYARDSRFCYDHCAFINADHLNTVGARRFTEILMEEVIQPLIAPET